MKRQESSQQEWDGKRVRALRQHLGATQADMASRLGVRQQTVSEWEVGLYEPRGASRTLLNIVAERASFKYDAGAEKSRGPNKYHSAISSK